MSFLAQDELITIIPNFSSDILKFTDNKTYGPFYAGSPLQIPLYLASALKKFKKCQIQAPIWMNKEELSMHLIREQKTVELQSIPYHYLEISQIIMDIANDNLPNYTKVKQLIADIEEVRRNKILHLLKSIEGNNHHLISIKYLLWN